MAERARRLALGALAVLLALFFLGAGLPKVLGIDAPGNTAADFERWGYPAWFRLVVGAGEVVGALLLLLPRVQVLGAPLRFWGAGGLALDMLGALATHATHGEMALAGLPLALLALLGPLAYAHRPAFLREPARADAPAAAAEGAPR